jgi:hypothetical protein
LVRAVLATRVVGRAGATCVVGAAWTVGAAGFGELGGACLAVTSIAGKVGAVAGDAGAGRGAAGAGTGAAGADSGTAGEDSGAIAGISAGCACNDAQRQTLVAKATAPTEGRCDISRTPDSGVRGQSPAVPDEVTRSAEALAIDRMWREAGRERLLSSPMKVRGPSDE